MERESLLVLLVMILGGSTLHAFSPWLMAESDRSDARRLERTKWLQLWLPLFPGLLGGAWLGGWAMLQPDPVPASAVVYLFAAGAPFALLIGRAAIRAAWSVVRTPGDVGVATVGLLRPRIIFSSHLAERLDERAIQAALAHERAHVCHHDPLRIWLAQFVTDLQWPWPPAQKRLRNWLVALELARDAEARANGVEGSDLAAAILASLRFRQDSVSVAYALLSGDRAALKERITALIQPLPEASPAPAPYAAISIWLLPPTLLLATALGAAFGSCVINPLLGVAS